MYISVLEYITMCLLVCMYMYVCVRVCNGSMSLCVSVIGCECNRRCVDVNMFRYNLKPRFDWSILMRIDCARVLEHTSMLLCGMPAS